jgi:hypothetical protein
MTNLALRSLKMNKKPGRNDPCPCGSGKKYKNCCLKLEETIRFEIVDPDDAIHTCAWCSKIIPDNSEIFSLGVKARPEAHIERYAGRAIIISIVTVGKKVPAIIPTNDSDAKKAGNDLLFAACSENCALAMKKVLQEEKKIFDSFN